MKILVTGASGLVGSAFSRLTAERRHTIVGVVGRYPDPVDGLSRRMAADLADREATRRIVLGEAPQAIVNCAAVSQPEACDANPALSHALNVALPAELARLAQELRVPFVHLSSEQVFDGRRSTAYRRTDPVSPINLYARQKVESEGLVHDAAPEHAITLRAPLLMGNSAAGKRSLHERLLLDWMAGRVPKLFTDEFRQPCTAENLAAAMLELCERNDLRGVFHWAGAEVLSRYELGLRVRRHFRLSDQRAPIAAATYADVPGALERRQPCLSLDLSPLTEKLDTHPQTIAEQLSTMRVPAACAEWFAGS